MACAVLAAVASAVLEAAAPSPVGAPSPVAPSPAGVTITGQVWWPARGPAVDYARRRAGQVGLAAINERGRRFGFRVKDTSPAASVFKVMLLAAYLRRGTVRDRHLTERDRDLLAPMIRRSDNVAASRVLDIVGARRVNRLARDAHMRDFRLRSPWGLSRTSSRDQARFMFRLERYIPERHEAYARHLLQTIVARQRWGIPRVRPEGWVVFFKGGWGSGTGRVTHQVAFLESGDRRIALAILVEHSPSHWYGIRTIRGVARRLLSSL